MKSTPMRSRVVIVNTWVSVASGTWQIDAACRGSDPELFVDDVAYGSGNVAYPADVRPARVRQALAICARCPVRRECLADARAADDRWTIRGGETVAERLPHADSDAAASGAA
ncbi:WhiB family transcriptional regulator [Embleya sp. NPDC056575]|uniref:WhiB family transcriptional regulator n=1 Tax=unclassified Embleya TaxID=2699296 RepID=UPI00368D35B6